MKIANISEHIAPPVSRADTEAMLLQKCNQLKNCEQQIEAFGHEGMRAMKVHLMADIGELNRKLYTKDLNHIGSGKNRVIV